MKKIFLLFCSLFLSWASAEDYLETLNDHWKNNRWVAADSLVQLQRESTNPDIGVLRCARFLYVFILPDRSKATATALKFLEIATVSGNSKLIELAQTEYDQVVALGPIQDFQPPTPSQLESIRLLFSDFPDYELSKKMRSDLRLLCPSLFP